MPFPSPALPAPALDSYEFQYNGLVFGGVEQSNAYQMQTFKGWDPPDVLAGDVQRPLDQGEFIGLDLSPGRLLELTQVVTANGATLERNRQQLAGVLAVAGVTEQPFYSQLPSGCYACMARPRKHAFVGDNVTVQAQGTISTAMLHASDPRWYAVPTKTATVGLPVPEGGVSFPLSFPVSFGGGSFGGLLPVENAGNFEMRPILVITGPCVNPTITNLSLPGAPAITINFTLAPGDTLTVDMDFQTIVYTPAGAPSGSSRRGDLAAGSIWWNLPPGHNEIEFTTADQTQVTGTLTVQSADAYIGL